MQYSEVEGGYSLATTASTLRTRMSPALATLILLIGLNLLNYIDRYIVSGEVQPIQHEFHATDQQMGRAQHRVLFCLHVRGSAHRLAGRQIPSQAADHRRRHALELRHAIGFVWIHSYHTFLRTPGPVGIGEATFGIFGPAVLSDLYSGTRPGIAFSPSSMWRFLWERPLAG